MKTIQEVFSSNIRRLRGDKTQAEIAEAAGIPLRSLQRLESGQMPREENLKGLARAFSVPETALFLDPDLAAKVPEVTPAEALEVLRRAIEAKPALKPAPQASEHYPPFEQELLNRASKLSPRDQKAILRYLDAMTGTGQSIEKSSKPNSA